LEPLENNSSLLTPEMVEEKLKQAEEKRKKVCSQQRKLSD
jgi:hypothetical protein